MMPCGQEARNRAGSGDVEVAIFIAILATAALLLAFAVRYFKARVTQWRTDTRDVFTLSDAARIAYRQAVDERMRIADTASYQNTPDDAVRWFERSIREVVPVARAPEEDEITRADLKRYLRWARSVR
jgi:hypothetical protein